MQNTYLSALMLLASFPALPCSWSPPTFVPLDLPAENTTDMRGEWRTAPPGGVWWLDGSIVPSSIVPDAVNAGSSQLLDTVFLGASYVAYAVPEDAVPGDRWFLGTEATRANSVLVIDGEPPEPPQSPPSLLLRLTRSEIISTSQNACDGLAPRYQLGRLTFELHPEVLGVPWNEYALRIWNIEAQTPTADAPNAPPLELVDAQTWLRSPLLTHLPGQRSILVQTVHMPTGSASERVRYELGTVPPRTDAGVGCSAAPPSSELTLLGLLFWGLVAGRRRPIENSR